MREVTRKGELSRAELQVLVTKHLNGPLEALAKAGVTVVIVAAPTKDPADGKAVIGANSLEQFDVIRVLEHAAQRLRGNEGFRFDTGKELS